MRLFCDCKTDEEKSNFFLSGRAVETGVIAPAISNEVAMAYHRCAQFKKENDALRAKIAEMERQESVAYLDFGVSKVTSGFRWDNLAQHHVPFLNVEFESVQANSPNDAKGWQDRDRLATMLNVLSRGEEK